MSIKSDTILFGDALVSRSYLHTFTDTTPYSIDIGYGDGTESYIIYLHVKDNKNSVTWCRTYIKTGYKLVYNPITALFTLGDTPVIDVTISTSGSIAPDSSPSPSNIEIEVRVEKMVTSTDVLLWV